MSNRQSVAHIFPYFSERFAGGTLRVSAKARAEDQHQPVRGGAQEPGGLTRKGKYKNITINVYLSIYLSIYLFI